MKNSNYLELIELYETLVNVVCDLGSLTPRSNKNTTLEKHLIQERTELLGLIEDQREKLQLNKI